MVLAYLDTKAALTLFPVVIIATMESNRLAFSVEGSFEGEHDTFFGGLQRSAKVYSEIHVSHWMQS